MEQARALFAAGQADYDAGRLNEALDKLLQAYRLVRSPELAFNVARVYERMGNAELGIRYFRLYLSAGHPTSDERRAVEDRITALEAVRRRQQEQIFAAPPSTDDLTAEARRFFERGVAMFRRRNFVAAMQAFTAAHRFAPLPEVLYNLAVTSERLSQVQEAADYYREYARVARSPAERSAAEKKARELRQRQAQ